MKVQSKALRVVGLVAGVMTLAVTSWAQQNPLVYISFVSGQNSGGTNVYQVTSSGAELVTTLGTGGGPVAVDSQQNVYTVEANLNGGYQVNSAVYEYAPGSTQGTLLFTATGLGAAQMTVGPDGTIYLAGVDYPNTNQYSVAKFSPPGYAQQNLPADPMQPTVPDGVSLDSDGNLFVGWLGTFLGGFAPCYQGCVEELPAGQNTWRTRLPDTVANYLTAGPFVLSDGSLVLWVSSPPRFTYLETIPAKAHYPAEVIQESPTLVKGASPALALQAGGTMLWATSTGAGSGKETKVLGINYPSGTVAATFSVGGPKNIIYLSGIAVSPSYYP